MDNYENMLKDVQDLLNQAVIRLESVDGSKLPTTKNYNYQQVWDEDHPEYNHTLATLADLKSVLTRLAKTPEDAIWNEIQYYTSNC